MTALECEVMKALAAGHPKKWQSLDGLAGLAKKPGYLTRAVQALYVSGCVEANDEGDAVKLTSEGRAQAKELLAETKQQEARAAKKEAKKSQKGMIKAQRSAAKSKPAKAMKGGALTPAQTRYAVKLAALKKETFKVETVTDGLMRATIRVLNTFEKAGWVEKTGEVYRLTDKGRSKFSDVSLPKKRGPRKAKAETVAAEPAPATKKKVAKAALTIETAPKGKKGKKAKIAVEAPATKIKVKAIKTKGEKVKLKNGKSEKKAKKEKDPLEFFA